MAGESSKIRIGTSGFSYKEWLGGFYPPKLAGARMLAYYAERLPTVEINYTFRGIVRRELLQKWAEATPPQFRFALKAPFRITHQARLKNVAKETAAFAGIAAAMGERLGPLLFQLPPDLECDVARLSGFLEPLDRGIRAAFEFRHRSWFVPEVFDALRDGRAALCIAETEDIPDPPVIATAPFVYLRLRREGYDHAALVEWARKLHELARSAEEIYVYFMHGVAAPGYAAELAQLLEPNAR
jgi:uncharacterized protein YecE (DUF72 family)